MRSLVAVCTCLLALTAVADARTKGKRTTATTKKHRSQTREPQARAIQDTAKQRRQQQIVREHAAIRGPLTGQSIGMPWSGILHEPSALPDGDGAGYIVRHPDRRFGTSTTVMLIQRAIAETKEAFPETHVLAVGDISGEHGGRITQHNSHQSGRDVDIGLFYTEQPPDYPDSFVHASADNLDYAATFKLLMSFVETANEDGGVQMIFLDYDVQGLLYNWAVDHGYSEDRLAKVFQFAHGRGSSAGVVRHWPNHDNHMHVRFKCGHTDDSCE